MFVRAALCVCADGVLVLAVAGLHLRRLLSDAGRVPGEWAALMLIALLKKLAVPVPIIGLMARS